MSKEFQPSPFAEQFNEIADAIEEHKERFNMLHWISVGKGHGNASHRELAEDLFCVNDQLYCGTAACIGGTASLLAATKGLPLYMYLPLSEEQDDSLFYAGKPSVWAKYRVELGIDLEIDADHLLSHITADMAITMLRNLASGRWNF